MRRPWWMRWMLMLVVTSLWGTTASLQAEVRSFTIDQLRTAKGMAVSETRAPLETLPAAVPYGEIRMPALPPSSTDPDAQGLIPGRSVKVVTATTPVSPGGARISAPPLRVVTPTSTAVINGDNCRAALRLSGVLGLTSYQQQPDKRYMALVAAATLVDDAVRAGQAPNLTAFNSAMDDLPWLFGPNKSELKQAGQAVNLACTPLGQ